MIHWHFFFRISNIQHPTGMRQNQENRMKREKWRSYIEKGKKKTDRMVQNATQNSSKKN